MVPIVLIGGVLLLGLPIVLVGLLFNLPDRITQKLRQQRFISTYGFHPNQIFQWDFDRKKIIRKDGAEVDIQEID
jgi:hypothetical protein